MGAGIPGISSVFPQRCSRAASHTMFLSLLPLHFLMMCPLRIVYGEKRLKDSYGFRYIVTHTQ